MNESIDQALLIRAPTMDDLPAVIALVNACSLAEGGQADEDAENWRLGWLGDGFDLATDAWLVVTGAGQVVGYEEIEDGDEATPLDVDGYVHPEYTGRGIGSRLLQLADARARQMRHHSSAPISLRAGVAAVNQHARELFTQEGYQVIRHFWRMEITLEPPPAPPTLPADIRVRPFVVVQDDHTAHAAIEEAFADHWGHHPASFEEWQHKNLQRDDFDPALWFLALHGEQVVGVALCFLRGDTGGWVRGLGVRGPWRGRGIGLALLQHAFAAFYARGRSTVGLGVDAQSLTNATALYKRAGMRVTEQFETYEKTLGDA